VSSRKQETGNRKQETGNRKSKNSNDTTVETKKRGAGGAA
jgi:hypothetical protein